MAQKRMFDRAIIETDNFLNVSLTAKALYFLLGMEADDEGFVSPTRVLRLYGGEMGDIKNLIDTGLLIPFQSGVVVITHWNENNYLDKNRIKPTQYENEKNLLALTDSKRYVLNSCLTSIEEKSIEESRTVYKHTPVSKNFKKPTIEEIKAYCLERKNNVDPERFFDFYESKGWLVGKNKMKDWKASVRTWERSSLTGTTQAYKNKTESSTADKLKAKLNK